MNLALVRPFALASAAALLLGLTACQTTTLENAWKAPEVGSLKFTKILVIGIAPVESLRRPVEESMKAEIKAVPSVASYELLPDVKDQVDPKKITEAVKANGIDGIITMRMLALEDEVTYHPGGMMPVPYQTFDAYYSPGYALAPYYRGRPGAYGAGYGAGYGYGYGPPMAYEYVPPTVTKDQYMSVETNIYNAKDGKLIWTGLTRSKNPNERGNLVPEVAAVVRAKLREQKLIP
jgi:hypothetical protein